MQRIEQDNLTKLEVMKEEAFLGGGAKRIEAQHRRGKLTARERIDLLLDDGSFEEFDLLMAGRAGQDTGVGEFPGDGVITGHGTIDGREVFIFSQDFTIMGGSLGEAHSQKNPGNLGAIIRVADAAAADAVIILPGTCNPYNPKVIRSTAGSLFNIPIVRAAAKVLLDWLAVQDIPLLATDTHGAVPVFDVDLTGPCALAFGSEAHGVGESVRKASDQIIRVPILGKAESLNVAMSASVCLYEAVRQRTKST